MPGISFQQAYALALGAYMSPSGNKSFSIAGSTGLPVGKNKVSGLLSNTPINLVEIPSELGDNPFNLTVASFTTTTSTAVTNEIISDNGTKQVGVSPSSIFSGQNVIKGSSKCLLVWDTETVTGSLPLNTDTVYISSFSNVVTPTVFTVAANTIVTSVEGPHNIARLAKTSVGTIQIEIPRLYDGDASFFSTSTIGSIPFSGGLKIAISNASGTGSNFNTGAQEFILKPITSYPVSGINNWSGSNLYKLNELVKYEGLYYVCVQNTTVAQELPTNEDFFEAYVDPDFSSVPGVSIAFSDQTVNGINTFRINIPSGHYASEVLSSNGRYVVNTNSISSWIALANNTTLIDEVTGGGTAGNQCGSLTIKPKNNTYSKGSAWLLKLSVAAAPDNTFTTSGSLGTTYTAGNASTFVFSTIGAGGVAVPVLSYKYGGDINESGFITQTEKNYHNTGVKIVSKLKK